MPASIRATVAGRRPARRTAVSPAPQPSSTRPGASSSIVAIEDAVTEGWRVTGLVSSTPSRIVEVACAAAASRDVGVAAAQLRIGQPGGVPAQRLDPRDIDRETPRPSLHPGG